MSQFCPICKWKMDPDLYIPPEAIKILRQRCYHCENKIELITPTDTVAFWRCNGEVYTQKEMQRLINLKAFL